MEITNKGIDDGKAFDWGRTEANAKTFPPVKREWKTINLIYGTAE